MKLDQERQNVYQREAWEKLLQKKVPVLERVIVEQDGTCCGFFGKFALVSKGLSMPSRGGSYLVELISDDCVRLIAYLDRWGRAFKVDQPLEAPPAREPDLAFVRNEKTSQKNKKGDYLVEEGRVLVRDEYGRRDTARYQAKNNKVRLFDCWYPFGKEGENLTPSEALARAYLALVYRPSILGLPVPERGFQHLYDVLASENALQELGSFVERINDKDLNRFQRPPALLRCLADWLNEAKLPELLASNWQEQGIRLIQTDYNNLYYLNCAKPADDLDKGLLRGVESALNCFVLLAETMKDDAGSVSVDTCNRLRAELFESLPDTRYGTYFDFFPAWLDKGEEHGEWRLRARLATNLEKVRFPYRLEGMFEANALAGEVSFDMRIPQCRDIPAGVFEDSGDGTDGGGAGDARREVLAKKQRARQYGLITGLLLAREAFRTSQTLENVEIILRPFVSAQAPSQLLLPKDLSREFPQPEKAQAMVQVVFSRGYFQTLDLPERASCSLGLDVLEDMYAAANAHFDVPGAKATLAKNAALSDEQRNAPEVGDTPLSEAAQEALAAQSSADLCIHYDAPYRALAEKLADQLPDAPSTTEAVRLLRVQQAQAEKQFDSRAAQAVTRLMEAVIIGSIDMKDQNSIVSCYLGEDAGMAALAQAKDCAQDDPDKAIDILKVALDEMTLRDGFTDTPTKVYRVFGSYAERILYNHLCHNTLDFIECDVSKDKDKQVVLAPDALFWCHFEIADLLEHDFGRVEEALFHSRRALEIAPLAPAGYRQMGRIYMLVGEMEHAAEVLRQGLSIALNPKDIAMCYYQLAYVLWKAGRVQEGALCYLKSLTVSDVAALQAATELKQLTQEHDVEIPARDEIDYLLEELDLLHNPGDKVYALLTNAASACTDAGIFKPARNFLATALRLDGDDALSSVLHSLGKNV